jgi:hemolysin activation/secretion protein
MLIRGLRVVGNRVFSTEELQPLVQSWVGRELTVPDLLTAAQAITRYYRERGYILARAFLPAQEIRDGHVDIAVVEGQVDSVVVRPGGALRLREDILIDTVRGELPPDGQIRVSDLDRALRLLNELPGLDVRSVLEPGTRPGTTTIGLETEEGPRVAGMLGLDNMGGRFTGPLTAHAWLDLNDPVGWGDQASFRLSGSSGLGYMRLGYIGRLPHPRLRFQASHSRTRYQLCCDFATLEATGTAVSTSVGATLALHRARDASHTAGISLRDSAFKNRTVAGTTSDKIVRGLILSLEGQAYHGELRDAQSRYRVQFTSGRANLDGLASDRAADDATARTHGDFSKLDYLVSHLRPLGDWTLMTSLSGQSASKNLDSSEKFSLGGPRGVRAYSTGEATGDEGWLVNIELRRGFEDDWTVSAYLDHGHIRQHKQPWTGWDGGRSQPLEYSLSGYGFGLSRATASTQMRAGLASRIGDNPASDASGNDSDGTLRKLRLWLELQSLF